MESKETQFERLIMEAARCVRCDRMSDSARVLSRTAGNLNADLFFVGEAPGRLGADATGIPFHGDRSGSNFEDLLNFVGIGREDIFVTNAVLCNPRNTQGNNATPDQSERTNCQDFLRRQIELVDPKIVVAIGGTALDALSGIERHELTLKGNVRTLNHWFNRYLIPVYHPSAQAMLSRSAANQRSDYQFIAEQWRRIGKPQKRSAGFSPSDVLNLARYLIARRGVISYFELHKLAYLTEYTYVRRHGRRLTSAYFIRQKDGPYCTSLELKRLKRSDESIRVSKQGDKLFMRIARAKPTTLFPEFETLSETAKAAADEALDRYAGKDDAELKTAVYFTAPMRFLLRRENAEGTNLYNAPIDFLS
jgi:uracil-DNA glycosylase family 4